MRIAKPSSPALITLSMMCAVTAFTSGCGQQGASTGNAFAAPATSAEAPAAPAEAPTTSGSGANPASETEAVTETTAADSDDAAESPAASEPAGEQESGRPEPATGGAVAEQPSGSSQDAPEGQANSTPSLRNPFRQRFDVPDFPPDSEWLNTGGPLRKRDLKGKFVILDFWTYCCINCIHILPELKKLKRAYPNQLVVIGVHSAKFETEKGRRNIEEAVLRYEIEHPVVNDPDHAIWNMFGVRSWPTVLMIDPEGKAVWGKSGEIRFETVDPILKSAIPYYRQAGLLDETPVRFNTLAERQTETTPLRFPGKVLADPTGGRLFISDSNHNRIVIATLDGQLVDTIGSGRIGRADGSYREATFDHPQGTVLHGETLYVADTENHSIRKVDLKAKTVTTIAGTGRQAEYAWPGIEKLGRTDALPDRWVGPTATTALNSPWALWIHESDLYIAMAGPHQIWKMPARRVRDWPVCRQRSRRYCRRSPPAGSTVRAGLLFVCAA